MLRSLLSSSYFKSQIEGDLNPYKAKPRTKSTKEPKPVVASATKVKKRVAREYSVVLVEGTKAVARGVYIKPDASKLSVQ